ncbi:MAG TPA: DegT/DnrJ/EryC1/StrS aminotransferase family protein [Candidatus Acidoferrales bacterium]|nr:DegT/DnrJ/EryC1/StrS aminotransferase family protein [Candidatus Acidoferrales bacterium]
MDDRPAQAADPTTLASRGGQPVRGTFLPIAVPWIGEREKQLVLESLESGWITTGPKSLELARRVAAIGGAKHGVAVNSATGALHLALEALGIGPGDEVITSTWTFAATVNVIEHVRATPVLVDVEPDTLNLDPRLVERAITPRTRVILTVDYGGQPCDYDALQALAAGRGIAIVDDAAHALGAAYRGRPVGSLARVTAFSFYATKNLSTGEGGAAVTDDAELAERIQLLSLHGMSRDAWKRYGDTGSWFYEVVAPGWKYNLSDVLAAIGVGQLDRFAEFQARRRALVERMRTGLAPVAEVRTPTERPDVTHAWHLFPIALELERLTIDRAAFIRELRAENIGTSVHFIPIHRHPHFRDSLKLAPAGFPVAEDAYARAITLPLFPRMSDRDADDVVAAVAKVARAHRR